jgi:biopolymer transport protein ExbB
MFLLQIDTLNPVADAAASTIQTMPASEELRFIELLFKGGWVMVPLAFLAFMGLVIFVERYLTIRKASKNEMNLMLQVKQSVKSAKLDSALAICRNSNTPLGRMLEKGLLRIGRPIKDIEGAREIGARFLEVPQYRFGRGYEFDFTSVEF